jgi:Retroviral aspartyl protease.
VSPSTLAYIQATETDNSVIHSVSYGDLVYLNSIEKRTFPLFLGQIKGKYGRILGDTGANRNFISYRYWKRIMGEKGAVEREDSIKLVKLPNGQSMKVFGVCDVEVEIDEWREKIEVYVVELQCEFDLVLGLDWHRKHEPEIDWKSMVYRIKDRNGRTFKLIPEASPMHTIEMSALHVMSMTARQAAKHIKRKVPVVLYYIRGEEENTPAEDSGKDAQVSESADEHQEMQKPLEEFKEVFRSELPDHLPPQRSVDHNIDTGDSAPVNTYAYSLSSSSKSRCVRSTTFWKRG